MNVKKFISTNRLFLVALLILLVIIVILLSLRVPKVSYRLKPDMVAEMIADTGNLVSPFVLYKQLSVITSGLVIIDIRTADEFSKGHIDKAINIPIRELLENRTVAFFKELKKSNTFAVLYGEDQLQANGPWMLLKQVGIDNVKVLLGGYSFFKTLPLSDSVAKVNETQWMVEVPSVDASAFRKISPVQIKPVDTPKENKLKVVPLKKNVSSGGGC